MQTTTIQAPPQAAPRSAGSAAIVLGVALAGAVLLRQFLLAESWITVTLTICSAFFVWRTDFSPLWVLGAGAIIGALAL